jgi:RNA polymerase sigma-70 factor (ECF subfamily)
MGGHAAVQPSLASFLSPWASVRSKNLRLDCNISFVRCVKVIGMAADNPSPAADERLVQWVREHAVPVRGYLLGMVRRADLADDLLQEVFQRAWQFRDRYVPRGCERAYLLRIADRVAASTLRRLRREQTVDEATWNQIEPPADEVEPEEQLAAREAAAVVKASLAALSWPQRRVLLLRYFGELSFADIAQQTGWPLGTVLSHCHRGLAALRKQLKTPEADRRVGGG